MVKKLIRVKRNYKNTIAEEKALLPDSGARHNLLLEKCETLWMNLQDYRSRRDRVYRYVFGDQWSDTVVINGKRISEREYLSKRGDFPIQVNLLRRQIDTIAGLYIKEQNEPACHARDRQEQQYGELMSTVLQTNWQLNNMPILYNHWMQELACGGLAVAEECYGVRNGKMDAWTDAVPSKCFFMDCDYDDPRFMDCSILGFFKDFSWKEIYKKYGATTKAADKLREYYKSQSVRNSLPSVMDPETLKASQSSAFRAAPDPSRCRVFEIWTKEVRKRYRCHDWAEGSLYIIDDSDTLMKKKIELVNATRKQQAQALGYAEDEIPYIEMIPYNDEYWYYRHLTPEGYVLEEGESPLENGVHPFSICAIPFINGSISGFLADKVDYQRAINRFLILDDWLRRTQAKGVTMVDSRLVPEGMDPEDFAKSWTEVGGILIYEGKPGVEMPRQFYGSAQSLNTTELVGMFKNLLDEASSANNTLQGKTPYAGTSAALYAQQTQNAATGLATLYKTFNVFIESVAKKKLCVIKETYEPQKYRIIAGELSNALPVSFDYENVGDIEYDLAVKQSSETPIIRMMANDQLKEMWVAGQISLEEYLKYGDLWFADDLLQSRIAQQQAQQQSMEGRQMQGGTPDINLDPQDIDNGLPEPTMVGIGGELVEKGGTPVI